MVEQDSTSSLSASSLLTDEQLKFHINDTTPLTPPAHIYTVDDLLEIWENLDKTGIFRASNEKRESFYSIILPHIKEVPQTDRIDYSRKAFKERLDQSYAALLLAQSTKPNRPNQHRQPPSHASSATLVSSKWSESPVQPPSSELFRLAQPPVASRGLVPPELIKWVYKDSSGNEQGPFDGVRMHEWYSGGWLEDTLLIKRIEEPSFYTLGEFSQSVGSNTKQFLIPQLQLNAPPYPPEVALAAGTVLPDQINWIYRDPSGVEQGPFDGIRMQEWLSMKWLQDTLLIRRIEETHFYTIKQFMKKINNYAEPFLVPLPLNVASNPSGSQPPQWRTQEQILASQREALRAQQMQLAALQQQQHELMIQNGLISTQSISRSEGEDEEGETTEESIGIANTEATDNSIEMVIQDKDREDDGEEEILEFIEWCKEQLKGIERKIDEEELLRVLLSIEGEDKEREINSIIYSNLSSRTREDVGVVGNFGKEFVEKRGSLKVDDILERWG